MKVKVSQQADPSINAPTEHFDDILTTTDREINFDTHSNRTGTSSYASSDECRVRSLRAYVYCLSPRGKARVLADESKPIPPPLVRQTYFNDHHNVEEVSFH